MSLGSAPIPQACCCHYSAWGVCGDGSALSQGTKLVGPAVHNEGIMCNTEMLLQGKFHYDMEKKVLPMGVAEHWKQIQRCDRSVHIEPQVDKAQDLNIYHGVTPVWKTFWLGDLHMLFSAMILFFWMVLLQSLVPIPHTRVHSGSLDDRSHVFTTRWWRSVLMFLSENYPFFPGSLSWWLHLESHSDSPGSWILVRFPRYELRP